MQTSCGSYDDSYVCLRSGASVNKCQYESCWPKCNEGWLNILIYFDFEYHYRLFNSTGIFQNLEKIPRLKKQRIANATRVAEEQQGFPNNSTNEGVVYKSFIIL